MSAIHTPSAMLPTPVCLLSALLLIVPLTAHSYERGAFAPKDPPPMPTIIVYSGNTESSEPSSDASSVANAAAPASNNSTPVPVAPPVTETAQAPQPQSQPLTQPIEHPAITSTPPVTHGISMPKVQATYADTTPAGRTSARHHITQLIVLVIALLLIGILIWWVRRPYTPPHIRSKSKGLDDIDLDLDLDN